MTIDTTELLEELTRLTKDHEQFIREIEKFSIEDLNKRSTEKSWSALECIEHLNRYGEFYIPAIEKSMSTSKYTQFAPIFKSGLLGNYFAKSMLPKEKLNKMKAFKSMNPLGSELDEKVLQIFIVQQEKILQLLEQAKKVDINKTTTPISITRFIKLRLGDTFKVVIYHNERHVLQAQKALGAI